MTTKTTVITQKKNLKSEFITESVGSDEKVVYHTQQNVEPVIEHVKHIKDTTVKQGMDMRHVAEVPIVVYQQAMREGWANDEKAWKRWLNNSDNKVFRTWGGKV